MGNEDVIARAVHRLSDKIDAATKAIDRHDKKIDVMAQGLILMSEGLASMQAVMGEIHKACTEDRPKSELKPLLESIKESCERTCDAVLSLPEIIHDAVAAARADA